jgi:glycosyltransferase involved in cell wall biosynthesis
LATVSDSIEKEAFQWLRHRLKESDYVPKKLFIFSRSHLDKLKKTFSKNDRKKFEKFFDIQGYSAVRNFGFVAATMLNTDVVIWLDDDELVRDNNFIKKLNDGFNQKIGGEQLRLITGACPEGETGSYIRVRKSEAWMEYWNKIKYQNEAFEKIIGMPPRWKVSPFAHGGLSAIHKDVFAKVPCDLEVTRGEDMDFNMNARMFGFSFFLDNTLEIRHCPPPRIHPKWRGVREDALRYLWQRDKIRKQKPMKGMRHITAEEFDPYPGAFLKGNLENLIVRSQVKLAKAYLVEGKTTDAAETLKTIELAFSLLESKRNPFLEYVQTKKLAGPRKTKYKIRIE